MFMQAGIQLKTLAYCAMLYEYITELSCLQPKYSAKYLVQCSVNVISVRLKSTYIEIKLFLFIFYV